jgi:CRP-like cAMP-binding protein
MAYNFLESRGIDSAATMEVLMKTLLLNEGKLAKQPFARNATPEFLNYLAEVASEATFQKGDVIFREKEYADKFYLILSGKVELETRRNGGSGVVIQTLGPGEPLGWSWLFPPFQWHFTARSLEPCRVLEFNAAALLVHAEEDPVFGYELMKRVTRQVIQRLQATRERFIHKLDLKTATQRPTRKRRVGGKVASLWKRTRSARLRKSAGRRQS